MFVMRNEGNPVFLSARCLFFSDGEMTLAPGTDETDRPKGALNCGSTVRISRGPMFGRSGWSSIGSGGSVWSQKRPMVDRIRMQQLKFLV